MGLFAQTSPLQRIWQLSADQAKEFRWFFLQILTERTKRQAHNIIAESAWLRLLLILVHRWAGEKPAPTCHRRKSNPRWLAFGIW